MTNYEFAIKHRAAFNVFCEAKDACPNPHDSKMAGAFRKAVEKRMKLMTKSNASVSKAHGFALIGGQKATVTAPAVPVTADTYAIRDTAKPRKAVGLVFDNATGCFV